MRPFPLTPEHCPGRKCRNVLPNNCGKNNLKISYPEEASPKWEEWGGAGETEKGSNRNLASLNPIWFALGCNSWAATPALHKPTQPLFASWLILARCPMQNLSKWIKKLQLIIVNFQFMIGDTAESLAPIFILVWHHSLQHYYSITFN